MILLMERRYDGTSVPSPLCDWPLPCPEDWLRRVNESLTDGEIKAVRTSAERGSPYGQRDWVELTAKALDLERTLRARSRPRIQPDLDLPNASFIALTEQLTRSRGRLESCHHASAVLGGVHDANRTRCSEQICADERVGKHRGLSIPVQLISR